MLKGVGVCLYALVMEWKMFNCVNPSKVGRGVWI